MAPPQSQITSTSIRPSKPLTIYRRGKPIQQNEEIDSNSDSESNSNQDPIENQDGITNHSINQPITPIINLEISTKTLTSNQTIDQESSSDDDSSDSSDSDSNSKPKLKSNKTNKQSESDSDSDPDSNESDSSNESENQTLAPIYKPVFISKRNRETIITPTNENETEEMIELKKKEEIELRKLQSQKLVEQTLIRELAEKEVEEVFPDVDDTDGIEPEKEFESWRLRELKRLKREKDAMLEREKEKEELEARRALPESERLEDDIKFANSTRQSKPKGQRTFLQKYHHKGAFYTDAEILKKHDFTAPTESTTKRMDLLPESMQVRDFGKMSRTKWTHLSKEDTTVVDAGWNQLNGKNSKGCFNCGGPHLKKDCPNNTISGSNMISTGTNGTLIGKRPATDHDRDYPSKRREADGELRRDHNRESNRSLRKDSDRIKDRSPISRHGGRERSRDRNSGRDRSRYRSRDRGRDMSRDRDRDRSRDKGRDRGRDRSRDRIRDRGRRDRSQDRGKDRDRGRSKDRDRYR